MYLDARGLIVQQSGDGGDTLQREGFWYEGAYLNPAYGPVKNLALYNRALITLLTPQGFVRNWQAPYNHPSDTSRDQLVSNIRACGYNPTYINFLRIIFWGVIKNFSRFPNGDIAFINDYGRFIRAFRAWWLYPLLPLFDVPLIVNSIIRCIAGRNFDNVGDDVNHVGDLSQARIIFPTPMSFIARKLYVLFRPSFIPDILGPEYALTWYFRAASGGNPEFAYLWAPIVKRF